MRIVISSMTSAGMDSVVAGHFGRCPFFTLVDVDGAEVKQVTNIANPFFPNHAPGQVPDFVNQQGANVMIAGGMGGRAIQIFEQFGIESITGASGTVADAIALYIQGALDEAAPCSDHGDHDHADDDHVRNANCEKH